MVLNWHYRRNITFKTPLSFKLFTFIFPTSHNPWLVMTFLHPLPPVSFLLFNNSYPRVFSEGLSRSLPRNCLILRVCYNLSTITLYVSSDVVCNHKHHIYLLLLTLFPVHLFRPQKRHKHTRLILQFFSFLISLQICWFHFMLDL